MSVQRLVSGVLLVGALALGAAAPAAAEPAFGTAPVSAPVGGSAAVTAVDVGRHAGFDRVVFRVDGPSLGYTVGYEPGLIEDGSGRDLPLAGSAALVVTLQGTPWTERPSATVDRSVGFPALRQVRSAGEFEGVATYGLGQAGRDGFRVFRLSGPDRIVVDLRHPATAAGPAGSPGAPATSEPAASTPAAATEPAATTPAVATEPDDDSFPLLPVAIGVVVVGVLAAAGLALRGRRAG